LIRGRSLRTVKVTAKVHFLGHFGDANPPFVCDSSMLHTFPGAPTREGMSQSRQATRRRRASAGPHWLCAFGTRVGAVGPPGALGRRTNDAAPDGDRDSLRGTDFPTFSNKSSFGRLAFFDPGRPRWLCFAKSSWRSRGRRVGFVLPKSHAIESEAIGSFLSSLQRESSLI